MAGAVARLGHCRQDAPLILFRRFRGSAGIAIRRAGLGGFAARLAALFRGGFRRFHQTAVSLDDIAIGHFKTAGGGLDLGLGVGVRRLYPFTLLPFGALAVAFSLAFAVLALLLFAAGVNLALRLAEQPQVMLGVLLKILGGHAITGQLGIARKLVVLVDDLLRGPADFAFGARTVEHPVNDVSA